jgi:pimeloyl-ACP methyl ester carboxylesterase
MSRRSRLPEVAAAAPLAWAAYSRFGIDHHVWLGDALPAPRHNLETRSAGRLTYYLADDAPFGSEPLVLLHSINAAASAIEMRPLFERYRGRRPLYVLDLPGFGHSDRSRRRYTPQLYAATIIEFLEAAVGRPADVVALSLTAEFAAMAALRRPELIRRLVLLAPTGLEERPSALRTAHRTGRSGRIRRVLSVPGLAQPLFDLLVSRASIRFFLALQFARELPDPDLIRYAWASAHRPGARHAPIAFLSGELFPPGIRETVYRRLTQPVLVLHDRSANTSFGGLPGLVRERENWEAVRVGPAKDLLHWERPAEVVAEMDQFFGETLVGAGVAGGEGAAFLGEPELD